MALFITINFRLFFVGIAYIYANLEYPKKAREKGIEGTVVVNFYMDMGGRISQAVLLNDIGGDCGQEALRIVKSMNNSIAKKWMPGSARRKPVKVYFNLPIAFELNKIKNE